MPIPSLSYQADNKPQKLSILSVKDKTKLELEPIAYIVLERTEKITHDDKDGSVFSASLKLDYQVIGSRSSHSFHAGYSRLLNKVSLSSMSAGSGAIYLDLLGLYGQRIGTYLMNEIVTWVKQWPDASVNPIQLGLREATDENKERRNRFYEGFGLKFIFSDDTRREGVSEPMVAAELVGNNKWKENIETLDFISFFESMTKRIYRQDIELRDIKFAIQRINKENQLARDYPIKWAVKWVWNNNFNTFILVGAVIFLSFIVWFSRQ